MSDLSVHCNVRGGDCYNPTCLLNNKCVDFVNRESYLEWKEEEHLKQVNKLYEQIRASERLRMADAASAINEANELRLQVPKWISLKDKLPKLGQRCLTYTSESTTTNEEQRVIIFGSAPSGFPSGVTHWMNLPNNPY